jgi:hypothetical protein
MNRAAVDRIANAVLYEGYILYPYRPSVKNRQRWTFGGLYPRAYSKAQHGTDAWTMQTQCLVAGGAHTTLEVTVRFLHLVARQVGTLPQPLPTLTPDREPAFRPVASLEVGGKLYQTWQEAEERQVALASTELGALAERPRRQEFAFAAQRQWEPLRDPAGTVAGVLVRDRQALAGAVDVAAAPVEQGPFRVSVRIANVTPLEDAGAQSREDAQLRALVSTHTLLGVSGGAFVSLLDPPEHWREHAAACRNVGTWPVLVGDDGQKGTMLSSPIILYDYPQVAPESPGDLFDGAEIDEILTLRILTLTETEKQAMTAVDDRARALLERTEALARDQLLRLHGTFRNLQPAEGAGP